MEKKGQRKEGNGPQKITFHINIETICFKNVCSQTSHRTPGGPLRNPREWVVGQMSGSKSCFMDCAITNFFTLPQFFFVNTFKPCLTRQFNFFSSISDIGQLTFTKLYQWASAEILLLDFPREG